MIETNVTVSSFCQVAARDKKGQNSHDDGADVHNLLQGSCTPFLAVCTTPCYATLPNCDFQ